MINIQDVNMAFDHLDKGDVDFRYVIDMASLKSEHENKGMLETLGIVPMTKRKSH